MVNVPPPLIDDWMFHRAGRWLALERILRIMEIKEVVVETGRHYAEMLLDSECEHPRVNVQDDGYTITVECLECDAKMTATIHQQRNG